jgi:hypothetical protein
MQAAIFGIGLKEMPTAVRLIRQVALFLSLSFSSRKSLKRKKKGEIKITEREENTKLKEKCLELPIHGPHLNKLISIASNKKKVYRKVSFFALPLLITPNLVAYHYSKARAEM